MGVSPHISCFQSSSDTGLALENLAWLRQEQGEVPQSRVLGGVGSAPALGYQHKCLRFYFSFLLVFLDLLPGLQKSRHIIKAF